MIQAIFSIPAEIERKASMYLGALLVMAAAMGFSVLAAPVVSGKIRSVIRQRNAEKLPEPAKQELKVASAVTFADYVDEASEGLNKIAPVSREYGLVIPKIEVNSKVAAQIDAGDADEYMRALRQGLVQAKGSVEPGQKGDNFIFGHSTDYVWNIQKWNALFYDLVELETGDKIYVYFQGKTYVYQVTGKGVYEPDDVSFFNPNNEKERLVLQTCWPRGTVLKRMIVFAEPITLTNRL